MIESDKEGKKKTASHLCFAQVTPPKKLSTYEFKKDICLFHILKWTVSVGVGLNKTNGWL